MQRVLVSIVTPSLNNAEYLEETIRSVLRQEGVLFEYFIQDARSTDGSVDIIRRYEAGITGWRSEPDGGQADAINRAFARTRGDILAWINADDYYEPDALAAAVELLEAHPEASAVAGSAWLLHPDGTRVQRTPGNVSLRGLLSWRKNWIPQPAVFFRRWAWERAGPLDTSLDIAMDYDLWCRLVKVAPFVTTDRVLATFRQRPDAKSFTPTGPLHEGTQRVVARHADRRQLEELFAETHGDLRRLEDLCATLLAAYVRAEWSTLTGDVVLFGAGAHTPWLVGVIEGAGPARVTAIVDDRDGCDSAIRGIRVVRPEQLRARPQTVVLSTDTIQETLARRCREVFGAETRIVDLYEGLGPGPYPKSVRDQGHWT